MTRPRRSASATVPLAGARYAAPISTSQLRKETVMIPHSELLGATLVLVIVGIAYMILYFVM